MNRRINIMLLDMMNYVNFSIGEYSDIFQMSEQTIRNDIKDANDYLLENNQPQILIGMDGKLSFEEHTNANRVLKLYGTIQNYRLTQEERRTMLALLLLASTEFQTANDLCEYLLVSRNTLLSDTEDLRNWFLENDLELYSQTRRGYLVKGEERSKRSSMRKLLRMNNIFGQEVVTSVYDEKMEENNIFQNLLLQVIDPRGEREALRKILIKSEQLQNLQLSDYSYLEVVSLLLVILSRIRAGEVIERIPEEQIKIAKISSKFRLAKTIREKMQEHFQIEIPEMELFDLTCFLRNKAYIKNNAPVIDSFEIEVLIAEFIYQVSSLFDIRYYTNTELYKLLENHLKRLIHRVRDENFVKNPVLLEVKDKYGHIFKHVKTYLNNIERYVKSEIPEDEVSFVVIYVLAILESSALEEKEIETVLVCDTGGATAQLLKAKINSLFLNSHIKIVGIMSSHHMNEIPHKKVDLIITTVSLAPSETKTIKVSPMMNEEDILAVQKAIFTLERSKNKTGVEKQKKIAESPKFVYQEVAEVLEKYIDSENREEAITELEDIYASHFDVKLKRSEGSIDLMAENRFSDLLTPDLILLDQTVENWEEAVRKAGTLLEKEGKASASYTQAMIDNIEEHDSYVVIYPGVAIPHAEESCGASKAAASIIRLSEGVPFGHTENDPVRYVIALSIVKSKQVGKRLYTLIEMLGEGQLLSRMDMAKTSEELLETIRNTEMEVIGADE